ncbi:hypothetical protein VHUM_03387 [Vanrija humicola]|uniref:Enoyl reductase (ER) domain-containing protein n=1 Tax=Vanrija humicola TaxID=5417 RepID=A0A7D8V040_VANHU|nr:hypothetical protein VHUM_03387 [Vanrija humicola]
MSVPAKFTGQAALAKQTANAFDLKEHAYTPRAFTENDVVIEVEACGICGTDIHYITCGWREHDQFPAIVGHEIVGRVVRAGKNTTHKLGARVGFGAQCSSCRECDNCNAGMENYCTRAYVGTYQGPTGDKVQPYTQGGYADYYQGPGHFAIPIPDGLDSAVAAPLLCAGVTVYAPLKRYGAAKGKKVGVIGIGGLGHLGVQFAAALGADTYAISSSDRKKGDAEKLGAVGYINASDTEAVLKEHKGSFDIILCTSDQNDMPLNEVYLPLLKTFGNFISVGVPDNGLPHIGGALLPGKSITGSLIGSPSELEAMFKLALEKDVRTWIETRPMKEATQAVNDMTAGKARYRYVLVNDNYVKKE